MTDILLEAKDLLSSEDKSFVKKSQRWEDRVSISNESWADSRTALCETLLKARFAVRDAANCMKCLKETAVLRCHECPSTKYLCGSCDKNLHEVFPFHDRDAIVNEHYQPIPPTLSMNSSGEWVTIGM